MTQFAKSAGYNITKVFKDEGVSGTVDGFGRPGLSELAATIEPGVTVLVENSDRVARDLMVSEVILSQFREHGVPVFDTAGVELTNIEGDATRTLIRQVLGAVAEYNKSQLVFRMKAGRDRVRAEKGRCEGQKPYDNQEVIKTILGLKKAGESVRGITKTLNDRGIPSPKNGSRWHATTVQRLIKANS